MRKGYGITILCLLLVIGGLCAGIYLDIFRPQPTEKAVDLTKFEAVIQDIEDSKDLGNHLWIQTASDGGPIRFRYDKPLEGTIEVLKDKKAAYLHTTLETETVTHVGYYELYYEDGWQVERTDGKPVMIVKESTYHYERMDRLEMVFRVDGDSATAEQLEMAKEMLEKRLTARNITATEINVDTASGQIICRFPWSGTSQQQQELIHDLSKAGRLLFYEGDGTTNNYGEAVPPINGNLILDGNDLLSATAMVNQDAATYNASPYVIALEFNEAGTQKFAAATTKLAGTGAKISIWLDYGEAWSKDYYQPRYVLLSAPTVESPITGGEAIITGFVDYESAKEVADMIASGTLPFDITITAVYTIAAEE